MTLISVVFSQSFVVSSSLVSSVSVSPFLSAILHLPGLALSPIFIAIVPSDLISKDSFPIILVISASIVGHCFSGIPWGRSKIDGLFFFVASRSIPHLPMMVFSGPPRRKNHQAAPPTPRQPQPSSSTPATPPMIHIILLFFLPPPTVTFLF